MHFSTHPLFFLISIAIFSFIGRWTLDALYPYDFQL